MFPCGVLSLKTSLRESIPCDVLLKECILICNCLSSECKRLHKKCKVCFNCSLLLFILTIPMQNVIFDMNIFWKLLKKVIMLLPVCYISLKNGITNNTVKPILLNKVS